MTRRPWSAADLELLRRLYPHQPTGVVAVALGRSAATVYTKANKLGLTKSPEYFGSPASGRLLPGSQRGAGNRYRPGNVPVNKGLRRPGWGTETMKAHWFPKGGVSPRWDQERYAVGALRENTDGYVNMKVREGPRAWRQFHRILWEDAHGPVPHGMCLVFRDGDPPHLDLANLELITRADLMRRNTIHNLPAPLKSAIQLLGALHRKLNNREEQDRGPAQSPVRRAGRARRQGITDGA